MEFIENDWRRVRANESGLPSHHKAYCDQRLYQQQRFMGTQIIDLSSLAKPRALLCAFLPNKAPCKWARSSCLTG